MTIWLAMFYGILQGVTEFLPVSSSGHLVLFNKIFGTDCNFIFFSILLHFATLFAVIVVLWKDIIFLVKKPFGKTATKLYIATIITIIFVFIFKSTFENAFSGAFLPICFLITAFVLLLTELVGKKTNNKPINKKSAILIGLAQGVAVLPAISRSGATICTAILCGVGRENASKFSFLLSIPIILASVTYEIFDAIKMGAPIIDTPILPTLTAFLTAFIVGVLCVKFMLKTFQKVKLWYFSIYLFLISILSIFVIY